MENCCCRLFGIINGFAKGAGCKKHHTFLYNQEGAAVVTSVVTAVFAKGLAILRLEKAVLKIVSDLERCA